MRKAALFWMLLLAATLSAMAQEAVTVQFYTPTTVRIVKGGLAPEGSFAVTAAPQAVPVKTSVTKGGTMYDSGALKVAVAADGKVWTARMDEDGLTAREGEVVVARRIEGVKLIVGKKENSH